MSSVHNYITFSDFEKVFAYCPTVLCKLVLSLLYGCALRPKELVGIDIEDIDAENKTIRLKRRTSKIGGRTIVVSDYVFDLILQYVESIGNPKSGPLFRSLRTGDRYREVLANRELEKVNKLAGTHYTPKDLREGRIGLAIESGLPLSDITSFLGVCDLGSKAIMELYCDLRLRKESPYLGSPAPINLYDGED